MDALYRRKGSAKKLNAEKEFFSKGYKGMNLSGSNDFDIFYNAQGKMYKFWFISEKIEQIPGTFSNLYNASGNYFNGKTNEFIFDIIRTKGKLVMIENLFK